MFVFNPEFGVSLQHCEDLFDCMKMGWCAFTGLAPLLENTKLNGTCYGRRMHLRHHTVTPFFAWLPLMIDDLHLVASPSVVERARAPWQPSAAPSASAQPPLPQINPLTWAANIVAAKNTFRSAPPRGPTTPVAGRSRNRRAGGGNKRCQELKV